MKYFRMTWNELLWHRSWTNVLMLSASIPRYKSGNEKEKVVEVEDLAELEQVLNRENTI